MDNIRKLACVIGTLSYILEKEVGEVETLERDTSVDVISDMIDTAYELQGLVNEYIINKDTKDDTIS